MRLTIPCCLTTILIFAGCRSDRTRASNPDRETRSAETSQPHYRVELIPNPQLTATSREGDKATAVYSRNIAAVYLEGTPIENQSPNPNTEQYDSSWFHIESIPNPELSPTSREGDKRPVVYSQNIIAVYVTNNAAATNAGH